MLYFLLGVNSQLSHIIITYTYVLMWNNDAIGRNGCIFIFSTSYIANIFSTLLFCTRYKNFSLKTYRLFIIITQLSVVLLTISHIAIYLFANGILFIYLLIAIYVLQFFNGIYNISLYHYVLDIDPEYFKIIIRGCSFCGVLITSFTIITKIVLEYKYDYIVILIFSLSIMVVTLLLFVTKSQKKVKYVIPEIKKELDKVSVAFYMFLTFLNFFTTSIFFPFYLLDYKQKSVVNSNIFYDMAIFMTFYYGTALGSIFSKYLAKKKWTIFILLTLKIATQISIIILMQSQSQPGHHELLDRYGDMVFIIQNLIQFAIFGILANNIILEIVMISEASARVAHFTSIVNAIGNVLGMGMTIFLKKN